jgi:hypothetical protein
MNKICIWGLLLLLLPMLWWSCSTEDDVDTIFESGTWRMVNYFTQADWKKGTGKPLYTGVTNSNLKVISEFTLVFNKNGTLTGTVQNGTLSGKWTAEGKNRTVHITVSSVPSSSLNRAFVEALENAVYYKGDSNYLMLGPDDKQSFIQLTHQ